MKKILSWFKNLFGRKYNFKLSEEFLDDLEKNTIHLIGTTPHFDFIQMECPCGCREQIKLSLIDIDKPHWKVKIINKNIFISPSIWRTIGCKSHFFIKDSRLIWAENKSSFSFLKILYKYLGAI